MKKILFLIAFVVCAFTVNAQRVYSLDVDTLNGNETVNFALPKITGDYTSITIQALCSNIGGTSDGTLILQSSIDGTSYVTMQDATNVVKGFPNDTLTIVNAAVVQWVITNPPQYNYRIQGAGTANDTTLITGKYILKK